MKMSIFALLVLLLSSNLYAGGVSVLSLNPPQSTGSGDMTKAVYDSGDDGDVDTCEALAANPAAATAGSCITDIDASGDVEGEVDVWTEAEEAAANHISSSAVISDDQVVCGDGGARGVKDCTGLSLSSINLQTGTIQGAAGGITDADGVTLVATQMNSINTATGAGDWNIPENMCDTATRQWLTVVQTGTFAVSITSNDAADLFVLAAGTALDAQDELDLAGNSPNSCTVVCLEANKWYVTGENGTCADGGAAD